ncbi:MAG: DUF6325 family protein [Candidatus Saccharimonadales bacterium]
MRGPIDYIVVGFEGNNFTGEILEELRKVTAQGTIAVLDLAMIVRDGEGNVTSVEITDLGDLGPGLESGLITEEDVAEVGEILEDNSSAGLLVVEQLWAKGLKQSIINANGTLLLEGRIHPEAAKEIEEK